MTNPISDLREGARLLLELDPRTADSDLARLCRRARWIPWDGSPNNIYAMFDCLKAFVDLADSMGKAAPVAWYRHNDEDGEWEAIGGPENPNIKGLDDGWLPAYPHPPAPGATVAVEAKPSFLASPFYGTRKSVTCPKCKAQAHQNCKRFDLLELKGQPVICPRDCPPFYGEGEHR